MTIAYLAKSDIVMQAVMLAFLIQWVAYIPAYIFQTEKFYDLTGSLSYLTVIWFVFFSSNNLSGLNIQNLIVVTLISIWAIRLGTFLFGRIHKDGEDKRFRELKISFTRFFLVWNISGMWVSFCSMCAITAISSGNGVQLNPLFYIGAVTFLVGFILEIVADHQKTAFRKDQKNKDKFINTGLWARSQHPNYVGEITLWAGIALISCSSLEGWEYITLISPIFTYWLLVFVSGIPQLDDSAEKKWGHLKAYQD